MAPKAFNLAEVQAANYDVPRYLLDQAYKLQLGYPAEDSQTDDEIREALRGLQAVAKPAPKPSLIRSIPNLGVSGDWGGRKRDVTIMPKESSEAETACVGWEGVSWPVKLGERVSMPWPFYNALKDAVVRGEFKVWDTNPKTKMLTVEIQRSEKPAHVFVDHGDTAGTEHLPTGYTDYFQQEAGKTDMFKGFPRPMLMRIHNLLTTQQHAQFYADLNETDIRVMIATLLGPTFQAVMDNEVYGVAA